MHISKHGKKFYLMVEPCVSSEKTQPSLNWNWVACDLSAHKPHNLCKHFLLVICFWRQIPVLLADGALPCFVITVPGGWRPRRPDDKPLPSEERGWLGEASFKETLLQFSRFLCPDGSWVLVSKQSSFLSWHCCMLARDTPLPISTDGRWRVGFLPFL